MRFAPGTRLGPYEIQDPLGAGGMGEVYRARDTTLGRTVALKVLPEAVAADSDRIARFRREAQTLAALNHPHIAQIYGVEDAGGTPALVMELVEGPTLQDLIQGSGQEPSPGALALEEALDIARQIAVALEAAHDAGIVHRDLKPANVKVRADGVVKVLDFGLAKAFDPGGSTARVPSGQTMTSPAITQHGVILGTASYMSPEQAKGRTVDKRADIWAFGVIVVEMLTGRRLFGGETVTETIASVIKDRPNLDLLPAATPRAVRALVARCLERDPTLRLRDIGEARIVLAGPIDTATSEPAAASAPAGRRPALAIAALGAVVLAAAAAVTWQLRPDAPVPVRRFDLPAVMTAAGGVALSPDGARIAYLSDGRLFVRALDAREPQDLGVVPPATANLFWSPDSQTIGFTAEAAIRTIPARGGTPFTVATIPASGRVMDLVWRADDDAILFAVWRDSLYRVPASGGTPELELAIDAAAEIDFHTVLPLPGNRLVVATHVREGDHDILELVDGARRVTLTSDPGVGRFRTGGPGRLLFDRMGVNAGIWTVPFSGGPLDFTQAVLVEPGATSGGAPAADGTLLLRVPATERWQLVWVTRAGATTPIAGAPVEPFWPDLALAPDDSRAAFTVAAGQMGSSLIVRDLATGADTLLTGPADGASPVWSAIIHPAWFPTGDRVVHPTGGVETSRILARAADGSGAVRDFGPGYFASVSPDGRELVFVVDDRGHGRLHRAPILPDGTAGPSQPVFPGDDPSVRGFDLSPDGTLLAYSAAQVDGQINLFLTTYPAVTGRWRVTTGGGTQPRFSRDGRELYFIAPVRTGSAERRGGLHALPVTTPIRIGQPALLLEDDTESGGPSVSGFDVAHDGRFLMLRRVRSQPADAARLVLVQHWLGTLRE
jgi:hypothetical protein